MTTKQLRGKFFNQFIYSRLYLLIGILLIIGVAFALGRQVMNRQKVNSEVSTLKDEIKMLESGNSDLQKLFQYFSSDEYLKQEAKLKFGMKESGEVAVVIADPKRSQRVSLAAVTKVEEAVNSVKWWKYFFPAGSGN